MRGAARGANDRQHGARVRGIEMLREGCNVRPLCLPPQSPSSRAKRRVRRKGKGWVLSRWCAAGLWLVRLIRDPCEGRADGFGLSERQGARRTFSEPVQGASLRPTCWAGSSKCCLVLRRTLLCRIFAGDVGSWSSLRRHM